MTECFDIDYSQAPSADLSRIRLVGGRSRAARRNGVAFVIAPAFDALDIAGQNPRGSPSLITRTSSYFRARGSRNAKGTRTRMRLDKKSAKEMDRYSDAMVNRK